MSQQRIAQLKKQFNLIAHPEGGFFSEEYRSEMNVLSPVVNQPRPSITHIYFLLEHSQVSRWHRVMHDEIWNLYEGDPLRIISLADGQVDDKVIGELNNVMRSEFFKLIKGGEYQAAETTGQYSFMGCTVAPGFDFKDFSYVEDQATRDEILNLGGDYAKFL
jgi:predicted cupin superfamily sugar epimerase